MGKIRNKLISLLQNIIVSLYTTIYKRDKDIILIGAWMGEKFSDNSRYLYQYLFLNRDRLGLKRVIWVTRSQLLNERLNTIGFESYLIGTPESRKWHLKSGVHVLCNMAFPQVKKQPDIDTKYSWGAVKFQLWHGVGMKSVGAASNNAHDKKNQSISRFHNTRLATWCTTGGWNEEYFLSTSPWNADVNYAISLCKKDHLFISIYPRNCRCLYYLSEEKEIIYKIKQHKKVIGYFPTFRSDNSNYVYPLSNDKFKEYLEKNKILWVEKPHSADQKSPNLSDYENILFIDKNFDLNVLYNLFDIIISDYSSVVFDCAYKNIPVIMYCPDLEHFKNGDVGFLFDIESYCEGIIVRNLDETIQKMDESFNGIYFDDTVKNLYQRIRIDFFENRKSDYNIIWHDMKKIIDL